MESEKQVDAVMDIVVTYYKVIEGRIKTLLEAVVSGDRQTEAAKSIGAQSLWSTYDGIKGEVRQALNQEEDSQR
jgi:hypothetical protein